MSPTADASCSDGLVLVEGRQDFESRTFHESLVRLYQTMVCWLDEPRLHNPNLYLPALPTQYDAEKLLKLFNSDQVKIDFLKLFNSDLAKTNLIVLLGHIRITQYVTYIKAEYNC